MKYKDFFNKAIRQIDFSDKEVIYLVRQYNILSLPEFNRQPYPKYNTYESQVTLCDSLKDAENIILKMVEGPGCTQADIYCFKVEVFLRNCPSPSNTPLAWYLYDYLGQQLDRSVCCDYRYEDSDSSTTKFWGRPNELIRFKPGDIVEVADLGGEVRLAVVASESLSINRCWQIWNNWKSKYKTIRKSDSQNINDEDVDELYPLDVTDDSYTLLEGCGYMEWHSHVSPQYIFTPHFEIPEYIKRKIAHWYNFYLVERAK